METEKQNWSTMVKTSVVGKGAFSEEMKQRVITRIEQNQRRRNIRPLIYIVSPLIGLMICLSILPLFDSMPSAFPFMKLTETKGIMGSKALEDTPVNEVVLNYEPAKVLTVIPDTDKGARGWTLQRLPLTSIQINEMVSFDNIGMYMDYTKSEDAPISYFGFQLTNALDATNEEFYEIGYGKMSELNFQKSDAFGLADFRLDGRCGPERRCVYWISLNQDGLVAYEQMDASVIYEQDLDGDGVTEAVVLTHSQGMYIYKNVNSQINSVHVQEVLKADYDDTVTFNPDNQVFQLSNKHETKRYQYAAGADMLRQLNEQGD